MNGTPLSRIYTLDDIVNRVLSRMEVNIPDVNLKPKIVAEINAQSKIIAEKLIASNPDIESLYYQSATIDFTGGERTFTEIESVNPFIAKIIELIATDGSGNNYGTVPYIEPETFKNISNSVYFDNGIYYTTESRRIKIYVGSEMTSTGFTYRLTYLREVNTLSASTDYMDLPSSKFDELVLAVLESFRPKKTTTE